MSLLVLSKALLQGSAGRGFQEQTADPCFWIWDSPHTLTLGFLLFNDWGFGRALGGTWEAVGVRRSSLGSAIRPTHTPATQPPGYLLGEHWAWETDWHIGCISRMSDDTHEFHLSTSRLSFLNIHSIFFLFGILALSRGQDQQPTQRRMDERMDGGGGRSLMKLRVRCHTQPTPSLHPAQPRPTQERTDRQDMS